MEPWIDDIVHEGDNGDLMKVSTNVQGAGRCLEPITNPRWQVLYDDATALLDELDLKSYSVVGEGGVGTRTALHIAVTRPQEVRHPSRS